MAANTRFDNSATCRGTLGPASPDERNGIVSYQVREAEAGVLSWIDRDITGPMRDFQDPDQEWRRLLSEAYGTFLLVIVAAGGGMMSQAFPNTISRTAAVTAPALMVMGVVLFLGKVSR